MKTQNLLDDDRHLFIQSVVRGLEKYKSEGECEK